MEVETRYGDGLTIEVEEVNDYGGAPTVRPRVTIKVDEIRIKAMLTQTIQEQARKLAEQIALDLVVVAVKNEREQMAKRVRDMGSGGRFGMDERQVELLAAAIEDLPGQAADMLTGTVVREDGTIVPAGIASKEAHGSVTINQPLSPNTTGAGGV